MVYDPHANQELTTEGLRRYNELYEMHGDQAAVNDHAMIKDAVSIVFHPSKKSSEVVGGWQVIEIE